jgi:hypothetical protein
MKSIKSIAMCRNLLLLFLFFISLSSCFKRSSSLNNSLFYLDEGETRSVSAENKQGEKGMGAMAIPNPAEGTTFASSRAADDLGQGWKVSPFVKVKKGETVTLMDVKGSGIIQHMWMVEMLLSRAHILRIYWDDELVPSVEVPVPDFFAVGHGKFAPVNSAVVTVNPANSLNSFWEMPFRKRARITFTNEGEEDLNLLAYQITYVLKDVPKNAGYFHAQWRRANTKDQNPYVIVDNVKGKGKYVGSFLSWTQLTNQIWFGEGEVKFFMDGDKEFPTISGTGTEDYFLGSFGFPSPYTTLYAGTTLQEKDSNPLPNFWSLYRWHIKDPINFHSDLKVTIQSLGWEGAKYLKLNDDIASVAYWYQTEPHAPFPKMLPLKERLPISD